MGDGRAAGRAPVGGHLLQRDLGIELCLRQLRLESGALGLLGLELREQFTAGRRDDGGLRDVEERALARLVLLKLAQARRELGLEPSPLVGVEGVGH